MLLGRCHDNFLNILNLFALLLNWVVHFIFGVFCQLRLILGIIIERWEASFSQAYEFFSLWLKLGRMLHLHLWPKVIFKLTLHLSHFFVSWWVLNILGLMALAVLSIIACLLRFLGVLNIAKVCLGCRALAPRSPLPLPSVALFLVPGRTLWNLYL